MSLSPLNSDASSSIPVGPGAEGSLLFEVPARKLSAFVGEVRRLTGRLPRIGWLPAPDDEQGRALVQIDSPPSVLLSRVQDGSEILVFQERSPGVWVRLGLQLEAIAATTPLAGQVLLIRAPDSVETITNCSFADPLQPLWISTCLPTLTECDRRPSVVTRLRLVPMPSRDPARLWVLREDALAQLTAYCRATHQQLLTRFSVAVSATAGVPCVVLRAITAKGPPPIFVGSAIAYHAVLKLPNLFVPEGTRLTPQVRRDAIRESLSVSDERIVWLHPLESGEFRAESIPEKAFRPLTEWVEYRLADGPMAARAWSPTHVWEFDPFLERADAKASLPSTIEVETRFVKPPVRKRGLIGRAFRWLKRSRTWQPTKPSALPAFPDDPSIPVDEAVRTALNQGDRLKLARPETSSSSVERCLELESKLLDNLSTQMISEGRQEQWAELAAAYDASGNHKDAALCWLNAVWGQQKPSPLWAWGWLRSEAKAARPEVKSIDPSPWLASTPGPGTTRAMAAWVVWASQQSPPDSQLTERAADIQARLESHEHFLPVRAAWLARATLARRASADVLGLARTRDRLSDRLLATGLSLEMDTPSFLRFAGEGVRERFQEARRWLVDKRDLIHQWLGRIPDEARFRSPPGSVKNPLRTVGLEPEVSHTRAYVDLVLAWGLMRFAEHTAADAIHKQALASLPADDLVHSILRDAFEHRLKEVRDGKPASSSLPSSLRARIDRLESIPRYAVDKLREHSRILEPTARIEAFRQSKSRNWELDPLSIEALPADRLNEELPSILQAEANRDGQPRLEAAMSDLLDRTSEWHEVSAQIVFDHLPRTLDRLRDSPRPQARLLEKGLAAAAFWDRADIARELAGRFLHLADCLAGWDMAEALTGHTFRCLRRLGLKNDADRILHHVAERILQGQPLGRLRATRPGDWPIALRCLLHAAAGWYYAGKDEQAHAILDEARQDLFASSTTATQRTSLAMTYASTLAQAPARVALGRLEEIFQRLKGIDVVGSTNAYYSLNPLLLVERTVRAVVSDDFAVGPQVRAWLDADELAVRRRIRDELKEMLSRQGL